MGLLRGGDFAFHRGRIRVRKTGAEISLDGQQIFDALNWLAYHLLVVGRTAWVRTIRPRGPRVWFEPDVPRPWYVVWAAAHWAGARIARSRSEADVVFHFEDATWSGASGGAVTDAWNARCGDISKSRVAELSEQVFGHPLALDPATWSGVAVEKSEINGRHDGRLVACPRPRGPGLSYQRLVETEEGGQVRDLRTVCVGGRPVLVLVKIRPASIRFSIQSTSVVALTPDRVFSPAELERIASFTEAMALDWGALDILRERGSGRLYVVDVNKTDVGPPVALSWRDKLWVTDRLAAAFLALVARPSPLRASDRRSRGCGDDLDVVVEQVDEVAQRRVARGRRPRRRHLRQPLGQIL